MFTKRQLPWLGAAVLALLLSLGALVFQPQASVALAAPSATPLPTAVVDASGTGATAQINAILEARRAEYTTQLQELARRVELGQAADNALAQQEQVLTQQVTQLQQERETRRTTYRNQYAQVRDTYDQRINQLAAELQQAQAQLAQVNAQLGR
jgi:uncharacterized phage infection (PIP) family protein YhgE